MWTRFECNVVFARLSHAISPGKASRGELVRVGSMCMCAVPMALTMVHWQQLSLELASKRKAAAHAKQQSAKRTHSTNMRNLKASERARKVDTMMNWRRSRVTNRSLSHQNMLRTLTMEFNRLHQGR